MPLIIFFISLFLFSKPILAATPVVEINQINSPTQITGETFNLNFTVANAEIGTTYYYKLFGGIGTVTDQVDTKNNNIIIPYTSGEWDSKYPLFVVDNGGSAAVSAVGLINPDKSKNSGIYNVFVRIAISNGSGYTTTSSITPKTISLIAATPTPTFIPTGTPTPVPLLLNQPTPTFIPITITVKLTPTVISTPFPTLVPTEAPDSQILGASIDLTPTPMSANNSSKNLLKFSTPLLLIVVGVTITTFPILFGKFKHGRKQQPFSK